jgi:hypothetical protein
VGLIDKVHEIIEAEFRHWNGASFEQIISAPQAWGVEGEKDAGTSRRAFYLSLGVAKAVDLLAQKIEEGTAS